MNKNKKIDYPLQIAMIQLATLTLIGAAGWITVITTLYCQSST